jgi:hypothetical protein
VSYITGEGKSDTVKPRLKASQTGRSETHTDRFGMNLMCINMEDRIYDD